MNSSPIILLRLEGPLQSWGARSRWDVRDTAAEPTKSGVIGLIGCALGYPVGDPRLESLSSSLAFGVRADEPGRILRDFQTVSGFLPTADGRFRHSGVAVGGSLGRIEADPDAIPAIIVSPRYYLEDASFLAAVAPRPEGGIDVAGLQRIRSALRRPAWPLYLGRKACIPTRPILDESGGPYASLEEALQSHPWSWLGAGGRTRSRKTPRRPGAGRTDAGEEIECDAYIEDPNGAMVRMDEVRSNQARHYGPRRVRHLRVRPPLAAAEAVLEGEEE